jgi:hypothetical protein
LFEAHLRPSKSRVSLVPRSIDHYWSIAIGRKPVIWRSPASRFFFQWASHWFPSQKLQ